MSRTIGRVAPGIGTVMLLFSLAHPAVSQSGRIDALSLQSGVRARIVGPEASSRYTLVKVVSTTADSLRYSPYQSLNTESLSWQRIRKMDASIGRHRHVGRGIGIGFVLGAGAIGFAIASIPHDHNESLGPGAVAIPFAAGVIGAIAGGLIGFAWQSDNWIPVTIPRTS